MRLKHLLLLFFTALYLNTSAQNLTGTWEGNINGEICKMVIVQIGDSLFGYTYDTGMGYCKANFEGKYNPDTKKLKGKNTSFIERTPTHGLSTYNLNYSKNGETEYLKGTAAAKSFSAKLLSFGVPFFALYKKVSESIDTTALIAVKVALQEDTGVAKKVLPQDPITITKETVKDTSIKISTLPLPPLAAIKQSRISKLVQTIETTADSIKLVLYDNGDIDGDTVTVFDNGKIIVEKLALSLKPYEISIPLNKNNNLHYIELMANNLGSIPPNTAFMLILAGKERYELRLSSDFSANAQVNIKLKVSN